MSGLLKLSSCAMSELTMEDQRAWDAMRQRHAGMDSPLLSLTVLQLVDRIRGGVEMGIARDAAGAQLLLPYYRDGKVGKPFAGPLADVQAVGCRTAVEMDAAELLRGWGLSSLVFHAQLLHPDHELFASECCVRDESPYIDISNGFEAYREERRRAKSKELKEALRKGRKIQRELGRLEFTPHSDSSRDLEVILRWKSEQLQARNAFDTFRVDWVRQLLTSAARTSERDCQGMVCCLRVGGELAAGAIAVRNESVMHGWVLAFNPDPKFRRYSPGMLLLSELLQAAPDLGIQRIDMGRGGEGYKSSFKSGAFPVVEGAIDVQPWRAKLRRRMLACREWLGPSVRSRLQGLLNRWRYEGERQVDANPTSEGSPTEARHEVRRGSE